MNNISRRNVLYRHFTEAKSVKLVNLLELACTKLMFTSFKGLQSDRYLLFFQAQKSFVCLFVTNVDGDS